MRSFVVLFAASIILAGCAGNRHGRAGLKPADADEASAIARAVQQIEPQRDYRISPGDLIAVTVYGDSDLTRKMRVSHNGTASIPLIGPVAVGGLTLLAAEAVINDKLTRFYVDPHASLFIEEYGNRQVFVLGEVNKPGSYTIPSESRMTVLEAVSNAGGFTPVAGQDRTRVLRSVNGKSTIVQIDVPAITRNGEKDKDLVLQPNDVVYVPQSLF